MVTEKSVLSNNEYQTGVDRLAGKSRTLQIINFISEWVILSVK